MSANFLLEHGSFGTRAVLTAPWSDSFIAPLREKRILELELNEAKGWRGSDIEFVANFPELEVFEILDFKIPSVKPVNLLGKLRKLKVYTYCNTELLFSKFPLLEECLIEWREGAKSLFDAVWLRELFVNRYKGQDLRSFNKLINLTSLMMLGAPITSLAGIESLKKLTKLRLGDLRRLQSLRGIERLTALQSLRVIACRKIGRIDEVASLINLRDLSLNNNGPIASLKPLDSIGKLESVMFYDSTNILDGDLSPLTRQEHLSNVSFQNRRHYSHRREDFWQYGAPLPYITK